MGSYLSKPGPPQPARTQESRDLREKPSRRPAARSPPPTAPAHRVQHVHPALPAPPLRRRPRRPSSRDRGALPDCFVITPRRRYPTQQAQYSLVGVLPTVCWDGCPKKAVLSARNSKMVCGGPGTVRIAPPDSKLMGSPVPAQATHSVLPLPSAKAAVPKASGLNALQERKKRVKGKEDPVFLDGLQSKRRCHDSNGSGHPTAAPQVANGALAAGVPKPGSLKRGLSSQNSHDPSIKRPCPSALAATYTGGIPSSRRNAITSSYSSTQGLSQPHKRSGPSSSSSSSSASSHPQMPKRPEKKTRQQQLRAPCGLVPPKASQGGRVAEPPKSKTEKRWKSPSPPDVSSRRKRKIQLLPCRRGEPLALPPAPQLGYPISAEEYDKEKRAAFQRLNRLLEDKTDAALSSVAKKLPAAQPRVKSTLSAAGSAFPTATLSASSTKKTQKSSGPPAFPESAGVARAVAPLPAKTLAPLPAKTPDLLAPVGASQPAIFPAPAGTSASSKFKSKVVASAESGSEGPLLSGRATTVSSRTTGTSSTVTPNCGIPGPPAPVMPLAIPHSFKYNMAAAPTRPVFAGQASATSSVACVTTASTTTDSALKPAFGFGGRGVPSTQSNATGTTASTTAEAFLFGAPPASGASFAPTEGSTVQFGKPPAMPASATVTTFGQSSSRAAQLATSSTVRFGGLGSTLTTSAPVTPSQPPLMFPKTAPAAFNMPFGSSTKPPLPSYPGANPQATCGAVDRQQKAGKLALALSFGSSLTLGNIAAPAPTITQALAPTQPALGSAPQLSLGGLKSTTAAFSTPGNTKPAFRSATAGSSLGAVTQSTSSGTSSTPFTFGGPAARVGSAGPKPRGATQVTTSTAEVLSFRSRQSGTIVNAASSGGTLSQKSLAAPSQDPGVLNVASTRSSKPVAGGTSARTFAQNAPAPALGTAGGSLSFGVSSTSTHGLARIGSFRSEAPSFSIGAAPKTPGPRQRLQARRQQPRKK